MNDGDTGFTTFVQSRGLGLLRFATALTGDRHQAEDLLQAVLEKAYARWSKIVAHGDPEWYLRRSIVNAAKDGWRQRQRRPEVLGLDSVDGPGTHLPFDEVVTRDEVKRALATLPAGQRTVIVLRYWEGLSEAETAKLMGVSVGTVKSQAHRAMRMLKERLSLADDHEHAGRS